jgi:hypothetical protein
MSTTYLYDGQEYGTEEDCIRAIVEDTYEYDDMFWDWLDATQDAGEMFHMVLEILHDPLALRRAEHLRIGLLGSYAESVLEDPERVESMLDAHEVEIFRDEEE